MQLINIGYGNMVSIRHVIAIVSPESAPVKRSVREAEEKGMLINATCGRRTKAVIMADSGHVILAPLQPDTIAGRIEGDDEETAGEK